MSNPTDEMKLEMAFIPGPILARAAYYLPDPQEATEKFAEVELTLRIRYERMSSRKGKAPPRWFWAPDGVTIEPPAGVEPRPRHDYGQTGNRRQT